MMRQSIKKKKKKTVLFPRLEGATFHWVASD